MRFLTDPRLFNFVIMGLYGLNVGRWAIAGSWPDAGYWLCALGLVICVSYRHAV